MIKTIKAILSVFLIPSLKKSRDSIMGEGHVGDIIRIVLSVVILASTARGLIMGDVFQTLFTPIKYVIFYFSMRAGFDLAMDTSIYKRIRDKARDNGSDK